MAAPKGLSRQRVYDASWHSRDIHRNFYAATAIAGDHDIQFAIVPGKARQFAIELQIKDAFEDLVKTAEAIGYTLVKIETDGE